MRRPHRPVDELVGLDSRDRPRHHRPHHVHHRLPRRDRGRVRAPASLHRDARLRSGRRVPYSDEEGTAAFDHAESRRAERRSSERRHELMAAARAALASSERGAGRARCKIADRRRGRAWTAPVRVGRSRRDAPEVDGVVFVHGPARGRRDRAGARRRALSTTTLSADPVGAPVASPDRHEFVPHPRPPKSRTPVLYYPCACRST